MSDKTCRTCGFQHPEPTFGGCPRWEAPMFERLNSRERAELARKLHHAAAELLEEGCVLNEIAVERPSVLAAYSLPRESYHAWYDASAEAAELVGMIFRG